MLDVLINDAGFLRPGPGEEMSIADVQAVVNVHLVAASYVTQPAWRAMPQNGYNRIVMTSCGSTFGHHCNSNYVVAKAGIFGLSHTLALKGEDFGIKVNCIFPFSETQISAENPLGGAKRGRLAAALTALDGRCPPSSVAQLTTYLASRASAVTGHTYSAVAGRDARVFQGLSEGWLGEDIVAITAEEIGKLVNEIDIVTSFSIPPTLSEKLEDITGRVRTLHS
jgi:NAD(P)-dependent dehydrogenase (short-subunit alcohol dehydrogenase family)